MELLIESSVSVPVNPPARTPLRDLLLQYDARVQHHVCSGPRYRIPYSLLGEGETIYVIQGVCCTRRMFAPVAVELARHFRVVLYDLPGIEPGDGANLKRYGLDDFSRDLFCLADHLGDQRFAVMGNSFGVSIAARAMFEEPTRIARALLVGGFARRGLTRFERLLLLLLGHWPGTLARTPGMRALNRYNHERELNYREDRLIDFFQAESGRIPVRTAAAQALSVDQTDLYPIAPRIRQPVMVVHGAEDRLVSTRHSAELANMLPNVRVMLVPRCGHLPHLSHPELLAHTARSFIMADHE